LLPDGWTLLGEVIAISGQLVTDLSDAANDLERLPNWTVRTRPEATSADS
ncbi:MAG: hypothetical protein QOG89_3013, partial [Thermomicrobiales bacterium]|nr:hypothetical protein [Thermomicrobiales bacterium]